MTNDKEKETVADDTSPESWDAAKGYASVFGTVPSSFTTVIRALVQEHQAGLATTTGRSKYFVQRLFRSRSLVAPFYFASKALRLEQKSDDTIDHILTVYSPFELAFMLSMVYLTRRARTLCDPEELKYLAEPMDENALIGLALGRAIPAIGGATGLMEGTVRYLALSTFLKHDVKGFKEYRREIKREGGNWKAEVETQRWGRNSLQVGSVFLQTLGFGVPRSNAYINAFRTKVEVGTPEEISIARDLRMATIWRESLLSTCSSPHIALPPKYYPMKSELDWVVAIVQSAKKDPAICSWLVRGKEDLGDLKVGDEKKTSAPEVEADSLADEAAQAVEELDT